MRITALIPAYNDEKHIKRSIDSALFQTYKPVEILVVDDGSTDGTKNIVESYGEEVVYFYKKNGGSSSARNYGIERAKGDWIAFLDSDDQWEATHLENFVNVHKQKPELLWYGTPVRQIEEKTGKILFEYKRKQNGKLVNGLYFNDYLSALPPTGFFSSPTMIIHRKVFNMVGNFNTDLKTAVDIDMWFRIGLHIPEIGYCTIIGANVYKRDGSLTFTKKWQPDEILKRINMNENQAKELGAIFLRRAEPRIIYWIKKLIKSAISYEDKETLRVIESKYFRRLPIMFKILLKVYTLIPFSFYVTKKIRTVRI